MPKPSSHIDSFVLKIVAILGMTANHVAHVMGHLMPWEATLTLYSFGGVTYPVMAFLLVVGYRHTSNVRKYAFRLFLFALASQVPFTLCFGWGPYPIPRLNVLFTLLFGLLMLWSLDALRDYFAARGTAPAHATSEQTADSIQLSASAPSIEAVVQRSQNQKLAYSIFVLVFIAVVAASYFCDWAISGPILVLLFYALRDKGNWGIVLPMAFLYLYVLVPNALEFGDQIQRGIESAQNAFDQNLAHNLDIIYITGIPIHLYNKLLSSIAATGYALVGFTIATVLLCRYNGKRGRSMKWFFYAYYPAHLLVIWLIDELITLL